MCMYCGKYDMLKLTVTQWQGHYTLQLFQELPRNHVTCDGHVMVWFGHVRVLLVLAERLIPF